MSNPEIEIKVSIPAKLKDMLENQHIDINRVVRTALEAVIEAVNLWPDYIEVKFPSEKKLSDIKPSDIPPGHYIRLASLDVDEFEHITDEGAWEYLDGVLAHHSPESDFHNAVLGLLYFKAKTVLDPKNYLVRFSKMALHIGQNKPEPDLMVFQRKNYRRRARKDGTPSEVIESAPLLVIEVVSPSSETVDEIKAEKYLEKGVQEYWRIYIKEKPILVRVCALKSGRYDCVTYNSGVVKSEVLPPFSVKLAELDDPDSLQI